MPLSVLGRQEKSIWMITMQVTDRFRAKREYLKTQQVLLPESRGQNMAVTVLHVPHSLNSGGPMK